MPRKKRQLVDAGIYHIYNRGNDRQKLFREDDDFVFFLSRLQIENQPFRAKVYHYCLMSNHFHLLLEVMAGEHLPILMHRLQLSYARYFKSKYKFIGHLFQSRFKSPHIEKESYYLQCGRYIERNPVKAGLVQEAHRYPWSSASFYTLGRPNPLLIPNVYYEQLGLTSADRQERYRDFLKLDEPYASAINRELVSV